MLRIFEHFNQSLGHMFLTIIDSLTFTKLIYSIFSKLANEYQCEY